MATVSHGVGTVGLSGDGASVQGSASSRSMPQLPSGVERHARNQVRRDDGTHIAFQVSGEGDLDLVMASGVPTN